MDAWRNIRLKARDCHLKALATAGGDRRGRAIVTAALTNSDWELRYCQPGEVFGHGVRGSFERADGLVYIVTGQDPKDGSPVFGACEWHTRPVGPAVLCSVLALRFYA